MSSNTDEILNQQRDSWNKFSVGWGKWDELTMKFLYPPGHMMLNSIKWQEEYEVLDIAAGTGEPGLTAAGFVPKGKVISTDLSEEMGYIAAEKSRKKGLINFATKICSSDSLPFADNFFDVVLCRFGFMFFPDILTSVKEMERVLKPGGYISTAVWAGPEKNQWATTITGIINKYVEMPPPPPDTPGLFRCAQPGLLRNYFEQAGLRNITEKTVDFAFPAAEPLTYWEFMTEVAAPVVAGLGKTDEATREKIKAEVIASAEKFKAGEGVYIPASALVITAQK
jgi:SAM-dependent methyltransferase